MDIPDEVRQQRYSRQARFPAIGSEGQSRLAAARVLLIGCGGLGSILADILVRAGVGRLHIVDRDIVELSNLQRQVLFDERDVADNMPKAEAARRRLAAINSQVHITATVTDANPVTISALVADTDLILDGTDNLEARYLINDAAVKHGIPWVYGAAAGAGGMTTPIVPGQTPCLTCLSAMAPPPGTVPSCDTAGVIAPILHTIAAAQATEAMRILTGRFDPAEARLLVVDAWAGTYRSYRTAGGRTPDCRTCGAREFAYLDAERGTFMTSVCGRNAVQLAWKQPLTLDLRRIEESLRHAGRVSVNRFMLKFTGEDAVITLFPDGRAIVEGTNDPARGRELYARYIGH